MPNKMKQVIALTIFLNSFAIADTSPAVREKLFGMKSYIEPEQVQRQENIITFSLYKSGTPGAQDESGRYRMNCETRESSRLLKDKTTQPSPVLAGEELYYVGKKFCEWEKKGALKKFIQNNFATP